MSVLGFRISDRSLWFRGRGRILEFSPRWGFALELALFSEMGWSLILHLLWGKLYIKLPFLPRREPHEIMESWGFSWDWSYGGHANIHLHWGRHSKILHMPWEWRHAHSEVLLADGTWAPGIRRWPHFLGRQATKAEHEVAEKAWAEQDARRFRFEAPYRYCLRSFEVQRVVATVTVGRSHWHWKGFKWLGWPRRTDTAIDVKFSGEVGERAGSWKGGCIGCGYAMRKNETPQECLRRMERERKF